MVRTCARTPFHELARHIAQGTGDVLIGFDNAGQDDALGVDQERHRGVDGAGRFRGLLPAHHDRAGQRRLRRRSRDEHGTPAADQQLLEKIPRQAIGGLCPSGDDQIAVAGAEHDPLQGMIVFFMPARRHAPGEVRRVADIDHRPGAEVTEVPGCEGRARLCLDLEIVQRVGKGGTHREGRMRHVGCCLAGSDVNVKKIQMARKRSRRCKCRLEQGLVGVAAADRDQERFHALPLQAP
jgi:hypothetical protein